MSMFKIDELSGSLIKSGRFRDAIPVFAKEIYMAQDKRVLTIQEYYDVTKRFCEILLNPNSSDDAAKLGDDMLCIAIRIPDYVLKVGEEKKKPTPSYSYR